jgi:hypothetical protein
VPARQHQENRAVPAKVLLDGPTGARFTLPAGEARVDRRPATPAQDLPRSSVYKIRLGVFH